MDSKRLNIIYIIAGCLFAPAGLWLLLGLKPNNSINNSFNKNSISKEQLDSCLKILRPGDVVLRTGKDATSEILRGMSKVNKTYSHCGIVAFEHGYPFVYHCIGGENNWNNAIHRDSFARFISGENNLGFAIVRYDLDDEQEKRLMTAVSGYRKKQVSFDLDFDLRTDDRLYCSEFVYKSLIKAAGDTGYILPTVVNNTKYIAIDNLFINKHAAVVCELRY